MTTIRGFLCNSLVALAVLALPLSAAAEMYRWVDENGVVHYGDRIPPKYSKQRREILNERGQTIGVKEREATEEERTASEQAEKAAAAAEAEAEKQAAYNRSLTATYEDVEQLDAAYADRMAIIEGKIAAAQKSLADIEANLNELRARSQGKSSANLDKRIEQAESRLREQQRTIATLRDNKAELARQHESDRELYLQLTAAKAQNSTD